MTSRLDELFSPERLRRSWQEDKQEAPAPEVPRQPPLALDHPLVVHRRLYGLIDERFPGQGGQAVRVLLDELGRMLAIRFGHGGDEPADTAEAGAAEDQPDNAPAPAEQPSAEELAHDAGAAAEEDQPAEEEQEPEVEQVSDEQIIDLIGQIEDLAQALEL